MKLLMIKNQHYAKRYEIKKELRDRGFTGKNRCRKLEDVPKDMQQFFEMVEPDFYL